MYLTDKWTLSGFTTPRSIRSSWMKFHVPAICYRFSSDNCSDISCSFPAAETTTGLLHNYHDSSQIVLTTVPFSGSALTSIILSRRTDKNRAHAVMYAGQGTSGHIWPWVSSRAQTAVTMARWVNVWATLKGVPLVIRICETKWFFGSLFLQSRAIVLSCREQRDRPKSCNNAIHYSLMKMAFILSAHARSTNTTHHQSYPQFFAFAFVISAYESALLWIVTA